MRMIRLLPTAGLVLLTALPASAAVMTAEAVSHATRPGTLVVIGGLFASMAMIGRAMRRRRTIETKLS